MTGGLNELFWNNLAAIFIRHPDVKEVMLFGSRAKSNYAPGSDIDLAVSGACITNQLLNTISLEIDELYVPYTFDLLSMNSPGNEARKEHVVRVGISVYRQQTAAATP